MPEPAGAAGRTILIVAPHPDDDVVIGAGVTAAASARGDDVKVVYMTNGDANGPTGVAYGLMREDEAVQGQSYVGAPESDLLFLGYPDSQLTNLFESYPDPSDVLTTRWGQSHTYADRGLGATDYHTYNFGSPAPYNGAGVDQDLRAILTTYRPDDIYTTAEFDQHPDHAATDWFVERAVQESVAADHSYAPTLHKTIVHSVDEALWPAPMDPQTDFTEIPGLDQTTLSWSQRESIPVPAAMQSTDLSTNPKVLAIDAHQSQGGASGWLGSFVHGDEIFWIENFTPPNQSPVANAGADQIVVSSSMVQLDGSASSDPDGDPLSYQWTQTSGPTASLSNPTAQQPTFAAPTSPASLTFWLVVDDGRGAGSSDSVTITITATVPGKPTNVAASAGDGTATVSWTAPSDGGDPIIAYTITVSPAGRQSTVGGDTTTAMVTGLHNGTTYTLTVRASNSMGTGPISAASNPVTPVAVAVAVAVPVPVPVPVPGEHVTRSGYWMLDAAGNVYAFGDAGYSGGAASAMGPASFGLAAVHLEPTPSGNGYWIVDSLGRVFAFGDAAWLGNADLARLAPGELATSLSATPSGRGYWIFTTRGRVLPFGDAAFLGDAAGTTLNGPVLASIPMPSGRGYYMVASDGGIFAFGDASFHGSMGATHLNAPVQSLVLSADGRGYWLVARDGGIFAFGDAAFHGSMGAAHLNAPIVGMVRFGNGYLMVGADGGIFDFSDQAFLGSLGGNPLSSPVTSVAALDA